MTRDHRGIRYETHPQVYEPAGDSFLPGDVILDETMRGRRVVELGCGSGLASTAAAKSGASVIAVDTNPDAARLARANAELNDVLVRVVRSDLASALRGAVDVVLFNPPYLPTSEEDDAGAHRTRLFEAWDAGPQGLDVVMRLADQLGRRRMTAKELLIVTSTLQDEDVLARRFRGLGYEGHVVREVKVPWERLSVWKWVLRQ